MLATRPASSSHRARFHVPYTAITHQCFCFQNITAFANVLNYHLNVLICSIMMYFLHW